MSSVDFTFLEGYNILRKDTFHFFPLSYIKYNDFLSILEVFVKLFCEILKHRRKHTQNKKYPCETLGSLNVKSLAALFSMDPLSS